MSKGDMAGGTSPSKCCIVLGDGKARGEEKVEAVCMVVSEDDLRSMKVGRMV